MGHGMTERDGSFTVREAAWHGLSPVLSYYPDREEAKGIAHPWEPITEPLFRRERHITTSSDGSRHLKVAYVEVNDHELVTRDDTGAVLAVKPHTRELVSNETLYDIAEALEDEDGDVQYETGGSLYGGRKVWLLLKLRRGIEVSGDPHGSVIPYFALQNSHDGSGAFRGQGTFTRIVCDNTSKAADFDAQARGTEFVFRHTASVHDRIEEAKKALAGWRKSIERYNQWAAWAMDIEAGSQLREAFLAEFVTMPIETIVSDRVVANVEQARADIRTILFESQTCEGIRDTGWGLVQASVEYAQHVRKAQTRESRFKRAYLDNDAVSQSAHRILKKLVSA